MAKIDTTVGKLVDMIKDGDLRLPEMQRRYVWPATRVRDLLDSLYRGYPSGTILVWETDREMPTRDLAVHQESGAFGGHRLLLDGQQRLTSLSAVLRGQPVVVRGRKKPIDILFNLDHPDGPPIEVLEVEDEAPEDPNDTDLDATENEEEQGLSLQERLKLRTFIVASRTLAADPHWVRVSEIFNPDRTDAQLLRQLVKSFDDPLFDKYSKRLQAVRKIKDYPYVMHVLDKNLSYEEVAEIFVRVNSLGTKLRFGDRTDHFTLAQFAVALRAISGGVRGKVVRSRSRVDCSCPSRLHEWAKPVQDCRIDSRTTSQGRLGTRARRPSICHQFHASQRWRRR